MCEKGLRPKNRNGETIRVASPSSWGFFLFLGGLCAGVSCRVWVFRVSSLSSPPGGPHSRGWALVLLACVSPVLVCCCCLPFPRAPTWRLAFFLAGIPFDVLGLFPCFKSHASAGHMVACVVTDQVVGDRRRQYWEARLFTSSANHGFPVLPTGCVHRDALWTVFKIAVPELPDGDFLVWFSYEVPASSWPAVAAAAVRTGPDVETSLSLSVAATDVAASLCLLSQYCWVSILLQASGFVEFPVVREDKWSHRPVRHEAWPWLPCQYSLDSNTATGAGSDFGFESATYIHRHHSRPVFYPVVQGTGSSRSFAGATSVHSVQFKARHACLIESFDERTAWKFCAKSLAQPFC